MDPQSQTLIVPASAGELAVRISDLERSAGGSGTKERILIGITGAPGVGKSTVAEMVVRELNAGRSEPRAIVVGMDGHHLANSELERLGARDRKGAIDTFDAAGFVNLVRRLTLESGMVYAPEFRREIEEAIAGAIAIDPQIPIVLVEGNYLLVDSGPWGELSALFTECWYLDLDESTRLAQLQSRHRQYGGDAVEAQRRAHGSDQINADLIAGTKARADLIVDVSHLRR